jgi:hypothetical protein
MSLDQNYSDSEEVVLINEVDDDEMTETLVISTKNFSDSTKEEVIAMTEEAVAYLILANSDIDNERFTECVLDLEKAYQYSVAAEKLLPETTVIDRIEGVQSDISSETITSSQVNMVPIMASLEEIDGLSDEQKSQVETNIYKAEAALNRGDRDSAMAYLEEVKEDLVITVVEVDVVALKDLTKRALTYAQQDNFGAAQQLIETSEFSVEIEIVAQKNRARQNEASKTNVNNSSVEEKEAPKLAH